jgi:hypothetical protein
MKLTIQYGCNNIVETEKFPTGTKFSDVVNDAAIMAVLGADKAQVQGVIDGQVIRNADMVLSDDDIVELETKSGEKGN